MSRVYINKGPCEDEPDKYVWIKGKGCYEIEERAKPVLKPVLAPVARAIDRKVRLKKAECEASKHHYWIVGDGCYEKGEAVVPQNVIPKKKEVIEEKKEKDEKKEYSTGRKVNVRKADCEANEKYRWIVGKGCFELLTRDISDSQVEQEVKVKVAVKKDEKVMNPKEDVQFGRGFVEHIVEKMKWAPNDCKNMAIINKSNELEMATCSVGEVLGEGVQGVVYNLCCRDECKYAIKVYKPAKIYNKFVKVVEREIQNIKHLHSLHLAPNVYDAWACGSAIYVVYEKMSVSLAGWLFRVLKYALENFTTEHDRMMYIKRCVKIIAPKVNELLKRMETNNIVHHDFHAGNIMLNVSEKDPTVIYDIRLIDLEDVTTTPKAADIKQQRSRKETLLSSTWVVSLFPGEFSTPEADLHKIFSTHYGPDLLL